VKLTRLMTIDVDLYDAVSMQATPQGEVRVVPFATGRFEATDFRGKLLPGGTDWQRVRLDGVLEIRAHYMFETDQGERIEVISEGIRVATAEVLESIARGDHVPADRYYFRTCVRFNTAAERLAHLNRILAISVGERQTSSVHLELYAVP
jgi:hypothetical protein